MIAVGLHWMLARAGYDAGPLGHIDSPQLAAAIAAAEHDLHWHSAHNALHHFFMIQMLRQPH
jgi:hypothetical protein